MDELNGKYLESKKISSVKETDHKTPFGVRMLEVTTEDGKTREYPEGTLNRLATPEPMDASTFRDAWVRFIVEGFMDVLTERDMPLSFAEYAAAVLKGSLNESYRVAEEVKWETDQKTVLDVDRVLKANQLTVSDILKDQKE